jgi:hypothetical protein
MELHKQLARLYKASTAAIIVSATHFFLQVREQHTKGLNTHTPLFHKSTLTLAPSAPSEEELILLGYYIWEARRPGLVSGRPCRSGLHALAQRRRRRTILAAGALPIIIQRTGWSQRLSISPALTV